MIKIKIISPGKVKDLWLEEALSEYVKRLSRVIKVELIFTKDEEKFYEVLKAEKKVIYLDPEGKEFTSEKFSETLRKEIEKQGGSLSLAIGGPMGFPEELLKGNDTISLSKMTLTHQMARLFLLEQIYRSAEIWRGSDYHK